jgi:CRISPR/Cas system-associated exonuclease Cas4 (RecB family)
MPIRRTFAARTEPPKVDAWSYSRYGTYKQCPSKYKYLYIDKLPTEDSEAMARGSDIHSLCEEYLTSKTEMKPFPEELKLFRSEFEELRKIQKYLQVEVQWALDENWQPTSWFKSSSKPDPWLRAKVDCCYLQGDTFVVIDHKTGRVRSEHEEQLDLYAIAAFAMSDESVKTVDARLYYLDQGEINDGNIYTRRDAERLKKEWKKKTLPMFNDRVFEPKPTKLCGWCSFSKAKGGPCSF